MMRLAVLLAGSSPVESQIAGPLAGGGLLLVAAAAGNGVAVVVAGREYAIEGVIIGCAVLPAPMFAVLMQFAS